MWQIIIVSITGILAAACAGRRIYRLIRHIRQGDNPCDGCCGCPLKKPDK
ncbi:MAG: FeoB-associated Cys-rich membrane protein [Tannerellaceae bacterium]|nr:FeoB-associated Cys-rich membrane protein [Tannerellaceae bacterium]